MSEKVKQNVAAWWVVLSVFLWVTTALSTVHQTLFVTVLSISLLTYLLVAITNIAPLLSDGDVHKISFLLQTRLYRTFRPSLSIVIFLIALYYYFRPAGDNIHPFFRLYSVVITVSIAVLSSLIISTSTFRAIRFLERTNEHQTAQPYISELATVSLYDFFLPASLFLFSFVLAWKGGGSGLYIALLVIGAFFTVPSPMVDICTSLLSSSLKTDPVSEEKVNQ